MYIFLIISNGSGSNCKPVITVGAWLGKKPVACAIAPRQKIYPVLQRSALNLYELTR